MVRPDRQTVQGVESMSCKRCNLQKIWKGLIPAGVYVEEEISSINRSPEEFYLGVVLDSKEPWSVTLPKWPKNELLYRYRGRCHGHNGEGLCQD